MDELVHDCGFSELIYSFVRSSPSLPPLEMAVSLSFRISPIMSDCNFRFYAFILLYLLYASNAYLGDAACALALPHQKFNCWITVVITHPTVGSG